MDSAEDGIEVDAAFWLNVDIGGSVGELSDGLGELAVVVALAEGPRPCLFSASA
jgi:hypothetical protein